MLKSLENIVAWSKRKWFVYPGSLIYGWLANSWDYWPYWTLLRKNIVDIIFKKFVQERDDIVYLDAALLMHPKVWEASGHVWGFNDPLIDDKKTWERFRADKLIEDYFEEEWNNLLRKWKEFCRVKWAYDWENINYNKENLDDRFFVNEFLYSIWIENKIKYSEDGDLDWTDVTEKLKEAYFCEKLKVKNLVPDSWTMEELYDFFIEHGIKNPRTKQVWDWTKVRKFSLMLSTNLWVVEDETSKVWLRPETAQWVYVNFKNIVDTTRMKVPFGAIQIWKAFRNEITPWNFIFRTREFEQAELQYFVEPWTSEQYFKEFEKLYWDFWLNDIWIKKDNLRQRDHADDELAHYANKARDFEYYFPWGWWELQWIHDRGNFDISNHQKHSWVNLQYTDPQGKRYIPHVVETALWVWRTMVTTMIDAYDEEKYKNSNGQEENRVVVRFNQNIAPIKFAILPLIKKNDDMINLSEDIFKKLSKKYMCEFDEKWAIWKRYRRQDEIWTPYCITVDFDSLKDGTVTIRHRDTMEQIRVDIQDVEKVYEEGFDKFK